MKCLDCGGIDYVTIEDDGEIICHSCGWHVKPENKIMEKTYLIKFTYLPNNAEPTNTPTWSGEKEVTLAEGEEFTETMLDEMVEDHTYHMKGIAYGNTFSGEVFELVPLKFDE